MTTQRRLAIAEDRLRAHEAARVKRKPTPFGQRIHERMLMVMEPGKWYSAGDLGVRVRCGFHYPQFLRRSWRRARYR